MGKNKLPSKIDHRASNFFKVLHFLSSTASENYYRKLSEMEEYNSVTSEFLDMIRDIHFKEGKNHIYFADL